jgi:hypothetical protein
MDSDLWSIGRVASLAGVTAPIVRRADDELRPWRDDNGRRHYTPEAVATWIAERGRRAAKKSEDRAGADAPADSDE